MLTHHLQDPNCNSAEFFRLNSIQFGNVISSKFSKFVTGGMAAALGLSSDQNEGSFSSERNKHSKMEKLEFAISRLMEKNNGQLFIVEHNRHGLFSKDGDNKSGGYYSDDELLPNGERAIFKIKFKPRQRCHVH